MIILLALSSPACCFGAEAAQKPPAVAPAKIAPAKVAAPPATGRVEADVSAFTSELSDQIYTRLSLNREQGPRRWYFRGGYIAATSRSYAGNQTYTSQIRIFTLDSQYRTDMGKSYRFLSASGVVYDHFPVTTYYGDETGYYMFSGGYGHAVAPGLDAEFGLAAITTLDVASVQRRLIPVASLRWRQNLTGAVSFDSRAYVMDPAGGDSIIDSNADLTYRFNPSLSMRLTYAAQSLLATPGARDRWNRSTRVSLVFGRQMR